MLGNVAVLLWCKIAFAERQLDVLPLYSTVLVVWKWELMWKSGSAGSAGEVQAVRVMANRAL